MRIFLHLSPTITSSSALILPESSYCGTWELFLKEASIKATSYRFYASGIITEKRLLAYDLAETCEIRRGKKGFLCCYGPSRDGRKEHQLECFLRHIRNSIAHSNVFVLNQRRKFIMFDDFNRKGNQTARILLSQTDLVILRRLLVKNSKVKETA